MGSSGEGLSDKRLAEIRKGIEVGQMEMDEDEAFWAIRDLLNEVARQRAREAALASHINESLTDIAQSILESGGLPPELFPLDHARVTVASILKRLTQARALLASAEQEGGGDGQQR